MQDFASLLSSKQKLLPFTLPGTLNLARLNPIPPRYRRRLRARQNLSTFNRADDLTALKTSLNPLDTINILRRHRWSLYDAQYVLLASIAIFSLSMAPFAPWMKLLGVLGAGLLLLMPLTSQFFFPGLPVWTWLLYFFCSRFIPSDYRPHIWVRVLPALENILYGANLSNILSARTHPFLDLVAWLPYGILHFTLPIVCTLLLFLFAAPGSAPIFARAFGWMNVTGVTIQLIFPCTPPWYENENGLRPAAYGMPGSPAGLARIDAIFGVDMYTTTFSTAPVPFGAFPSLHSGNAVIEALFVAYCFPRLRSLCVGYVIWIWWSTMYLSHHYAVDLVGGGLISAAFFYVCKAYFMPRPQADKRNRWEYEYVEVGDRHAASKTFDEEFGSYTLGLLRARRVEADSDEWTVGSSSASSSGGSGSLSPTFSDESLLSASASGAGSEVVRRGLVEVTPGGHFWDAGVPRRDAELREVVVVG